MSVNWMRLIIAIIAAYVTYGVLYIGSMLLLFPEMQTVVETMGRSPEDPLTMWTHIGHVIETAVVVAIYFLYVKSNEVRDGAVYGALFGLYFAATQLSTMGSFVVWPVNMTFQFIPVHVAVGIVVGMVLAALYRPVSDLTGTAAPASAE